LPGVVIGEGSVVGGASTVTRDVPPFSLAIGSPARVIREPPEFPQQLNEKQKIDIMFKILNDFEKYLKYIGYEINVEYLQNDFVKLHDVHGNKIILFALKSLNEIRDENLREGQALVALYAIPAEIVVQLNEKGIIWIDLQQKTCSFKSNSIVDELKSFIGRYGIRIY